jgi:hypothetical protein
MTVGHSAGMKVGKTDPTTAATMVDLMVETRARTWDGKLDARKAGWKEELTALLKV